MIKQPMIQTVAKYENGVELKHQIQPENRQYLLLLFFKDESKTFEVITGREAVYGYIANMVSDIDIDKSHILVTGSKLEDMATIYTFMKHVENLFPEFNFSIDDYKEDHDEETDEGMCEEEERPISISNIPNKDIESEDI